MSAGDQEARECGAGCYEGSQGVSCSRARGEIALLHLSHYRGVEALCRPLCAAVAPQPLLFGRHALRRPYRCLFAAGRKAPPYHRSESWIVFLPCSVLRQLAQTDSELGVRSLGEGLAGLNWRWIALALPPPKFSHTKTISITPRSNSTFNTPHKNLTPAPPTPLLSIMTTFLLTNE